MQVPTLGRNFPNRLVLGEGWDPGQERLGAADALPRVGPGQRGGEGAHTPQEESLGVQAHAEASARGLQLLEDSPAPLPRPELPTARVGPNRWRRRSAAPLRPKARRWRPAAGVARVGGAGGSPCAEAMRRHWGLDSLGCERRPLPEKLELLWRLSGTPSIYPLPFHFFPSTSCFTCISPPFVFLSPSFLSSAFFPPPL